MITRAQRFVLFLPLALVVVPFLVWPPSLEHYAEIGVAEPTYRQELLTSLLLSCLATVLTSAIALLAAYGLARSQAPSRRIVIQGFLLLASLPVMGYVIPLNETMHRLRLTDSFAGVTLAGTAVYLPLAIYILYGYLVGMARDVEEAAYLDDATTWHVLWSIVLPIVSPAILATACILFVLNWNLFLIPLVLTVSRVKTIPVAMSDFFTFERELEWPTAAAALIGSLLPLAAFVALAHLRINSGSWAASREYCMYKKVRREATLYRLFEIGVWGKGIDGVLEIVGGALLLVVSPTLLNQWVIVLTQHELDEDPHDLIATLARRSVVQLSANTQLFASFYLLLHGLVKVGLMVGLLRGKRWAYPAAIAFLGLFIAYQCYQLSNHYSSGLLVLTLFDAAIVALTWHEYRLRSYQ
jgi:uncharacterized membrane protein/ABC-type glycerol-3-phosphate transport system permease component